MGKLRRFIRLSPGARAILVRSALLLMAVRLGLAFLPFRSVERGTLRLMKGAPGANNDGANDDGANNDRVSGERLAWIVQAASRSVPGAECLARAIVLQALLRRYGYAARLRMDFAKDRGDEFAGHAWVDCQGQALLNGGRSGR